jgi:hypothetical protein
MCALQESHTMHFPGKAYTAGNIKMRRSLSIQAFFWYTTKMGLFDLAIGFLVVVVWITMG